MATELNWLLTGPGAISGLLAAGLSEQQQHIAWLNRSSGPSSINWSLHKAGQVTDYQTPKFHKQWLPNVVVLAVKSYDLPQALMTLDQLALADNCPIIISHNGIIDIQHQRPLFPLLTTHAATRDGVEIKENGGGQSWLAETAINQPVTLPEPIGDILQQAFPPLSVMEDITPRRWHKLLINCVINPLTAIYQITNGELANPCYQPQKSALIGEFGLVATACGHYFDTQQAHSVVAQVIDATANNRSSMLVDIDNKRPTEIEAMNGYIVRKAQQHGIKVPTHAGLVATILSKQRS